MTDSQDSQETKAGRPRGRPPKEQSLTKFLHKVFDEERAITAIGFPDGERVINTKELVAEYIRGAVTKGEVTLVTGDVYKLTTESWLDLIKWSYNRMDGNPVTPIEADTTTHLVFDAIPTVEQDFLPDPNVIEVKALDVTNEVVGTL